MSKKGVAIVIGRAAVDDCYRNYLREHPNDALDGYELSREGRAAIAGIDYKSPDKFSKDVSRRMSDWQVGRARG